MTGRCSSNCPSPSTSGRHRVKIVSRQEIASIIESLDVDPLTVIAGGNFATPRELMGVIDAARPQLRLFGINCQAGWPVRPGVETLTPFIGPGVRGTPGVTYIPSRLSLVPRLFESAVVPDVVLLHTTVPHDGKVSLGIEVNILPAAIEAVRARGGFVIAQLNRAMPYTYGDAEIDVESIDLAIEAEAPLVSPDVTDLDEHIHEIGARVAAFVGDGATVQLGIGGVPDAVANELVSRRGLGVWSEMISDGVLRVERAGAIDATRPIVASFLFGSPDLYEWAHHNRALVMRRTEVTNNPGVISSIPLMVAINTAIEVDLHAQANATYVRGTPWSGFGGQSDFVVGAMHSNDGHAIVALRSWHDKTGSSTVAPSLTAPATSFQHSIIVSEHGTAEIFGASDLEQATSIIEHVADPRVRDSLRSALPLFYL